MEILRRRRQDDKSVHRIFYTCGICRLMTELGLKEYIPAMCTLDYDMAELNDTVFTREQTLADGESLCDCHYDHKPHN